MDGGGGEGRVERCEWLLRRHLAALAATFHPVTARRVADTIYWDRWIKLHRFLAANRPQPARVDRFIQPN